MMTRVFLAMAAAGLACAAFATAALALDLNSFRAQHGLKPLSASATLNAKARAHAADMARRGSMDHNGFIERMRGTGSFAAENVAAGCATADCVFKLWADSPGHRANMLNGTVTHYGLASATAAGGQRYWALELAAQARPARRRGKSGGVEFHGQLY